jgi:hypothetical protein
MRRGRKSKRKNEARKSDGIEAGEKKKGTKGRE